MGTVIIVLLLSAIPLYVSYRIGRGVERAAAESANKKRIARALKAEENKLKRATEKHFQGLLEEEHERRTAPAESEEVELRKRVEDLEVQYQRSPHYVTPEFQESYARKYQVDLLKDRKNIWKGHLRLQPCNVLPDLFELLQEDGGDIGIL